MIEIIIELRSNITGASKTNLQMSDRIKIIEYCFYNIWIEGKLIKQFVYVFENNLNECQVID